VDDGALRDFEFCVYDKDTSTMVIKLKKNQTRLVDPKDLLKFGKEDIYVLSRYQLIVEHVIFEAMLKTFTSMVATIIEKKI